MPRTLIYGIEGPAYYCMHCATYYALKDIDNRRLICNQCVAQLDKETNGEQEDN